MRPVVIVEPDEARDGPSAMGEGPLALEGKTFVVDRAEEAFDLAIRLRPMGRNK